MASEVPTVTVLIATYNKAAALKHAIDSVLWQTFIDFELWVIGDGCTDESEALVTGYTDPRVNWYNLPQNSGYQSEPHNEGLRRARGRFIAYLNHDDVWLPNHLAVLVDTLETSGADFAYSILVWILNYAENYADIPHYPDAARPPEASATLHRRQIVDDLGFWRPPEETYAVPRAEYFRRAQFAGRRFAFAPMLTVLKFGSAGGGYSAAGDQPAYIERIREEPDFAERELASLLATATHRLEMPAPPRRVAGQYAEALRRRLVRRKIDPARLLFWRGPGRGIKAWRRAHRLDD